MADTQQTKIRRQSSDEDAPVSQDPVNTDSANMARSVKRGAGGRLLGSTQDPHNAAVMAEAAAKKNFVN